MIKLLNVKVLSLSATLVFLCGCDSRDADISINTYVNYEEAARSGAIERGWLPADFPRDAYDIHESHKIDTGQVMLAFRYVDSDARQLAKDCVRAASLQLPSRQQTDRFEIMWPEELVQGKGHQDLRQLSAFSCSKRHEAVIMGGWLAIDVKNRAAWYWTDGTVGKNSRHF